MRRDSLPACLDWMDPVKGVRMVTYGEFEGFCEACRQWWPLDRGFWESHSGMRRCRACVHERRPVRGQKPSPRVLTDAQREARRIAHREYNREWMRRWRTQRRRDAQRFEAAA